MRHRALFRAAGVGSSDPVLLHSSETASTGPLMDQAQLQAEAVRLVQVPGVDAYENAVRGGLVDTTQLACLLCQRQLDSADKLARHVKESKLHASNLTAARERLLAAMT